METERKTSGAFFGLIIIIIILVIGGIYIWQSQIKRMEEIKLQNSIIATQNANTVK